MRPHSPTLKATPGPWRWGMDDDGVGTLYGGEVIEPLPIADFWRKSLRLKPQDTRFESALKAEQIANLNLCIAAPDLYEALMRLLHPPVKAGPVGSIEKAEAQIATDLVFAKAALAKARGETP